MPESEEAKRKSKLWDRILQVLAVMVIPLFVWGINLGENNAVLNERVSELQKNHEKTEKMADAINKNTLALTRLETILNAVQKNLDAIKGVLRSP